MEELQQLLKLIQAYQLGIAFIISVCCFIFILYLSLLGIDINSLIIIPENENEMRCDQ